MHKIKGEARRHAWRDSKNPFAKRAYSNNRTRDLQGELEAGNGAPLFRPNTDDPYDYPQQRSSDGNAPEWSVDNHLKQPATLPNAVSRREINGPSDHIGQVPYSTSPPSSVRKLPVQGETMSGEKPTEMVNGSDRTITENYDPGTNNTEEPKKRGMKGWFKHSSTKKKEKEKESADDNNGKDKKKHKFTAASQVRATLFNSWINILLIASPIGIAIYYAHVNPIVVFVVNFIAIIPLAAMLSYATEEIALRTGEVIGGLLNASFGNAVELIVSVIALTQDQILIVQTSLIGSMLSNLLLVLGMCFFAGGINRMEQAFNLTVAQTASSLLFLAVSSLLIPTAFNEWANTGQTDKTTTSTLVPGEASLSRATSILLLFVYAAYLFFQLKSHNVMYATASEKNEKRDLKTGAKNIKNKFLRKPAEVRSTNSDNNDEDAKDEPEEPQLSLWVAIATLAASTVLVALNAEYLVDSIDAVTTCESGISKNFVGLILLPIVGNAAEHATAVTVAIKDKMDLAIGVAVGSSMQIALLVLPLIVVLGWIIGKNDMTLYFDGFQIAVLFVAILLVNYLIQDGKSHWLEGVLLMILYVIIAVAAWFYPSAECPSTTSTAS